MHILTNIHKMCVVKVKASSKMSENGRTLANIVIAEPNILLYKPQQYILYTQQQQQYLQYPTSIRISQR